ASVLVIVTLPDGVVAVVVFVLVSVVMPPVVTTFCTSALTGIRTFGVAAGLSSVATSLGLGPVGVASTTSGPASAGVLTTSLSPPPGRVALVAVIVTGTSGRPLPAALSTLIVHLPGVPITCGVVGAVIDVVHGPWLALASACSFDTDAL